MKNYKGNMLLIELVIVILFFSLSQVVLVQVFAGAQRSTLDSEKMSGALLMAQDLVEQLAVNEEPDTLLMELEFFGQDGSYIYMTPQGIDLYATVQRLNQPSGQLVTVELSAKQGDKVLFTLPSVRYFPAEVRHEQ